MLTGDANTSEERTLNTAIRFFLGSAAASFLAVLQILTLTSPDISLKVSLFAFSISLPINIGMGTLLHRLQGVLAKWIRNIGILGPYISLIGFMAIFWHFSYVIGIAFIIATAVVYLIYMHSLGRSTE
jgi:hypothetical protein